VSGGHLSATGAGSLSQANPLPATSVPAGAFVMTATPPSGYDMVACGGPATVTSVNSATEPLTVPPGGSATGVFYVAAIPALSQTIAGHIFDCTSGVATTYEVNGGQLSASGPSSVPVQTNPLPSTSVPAGTYAMTATPPPGYQMVACGTTDTVTSTGSSASAPVAVPSGGSGVGIFYVASTPAPDTQTLAAHIFDCTTGAPTNSEVPGGSVSASGPSSVPSQANPLAPTSVAAGAYSVHATAPAGYSMVVCGTTAVVTSATTALEAVTVPASGRGVGIFYVSQNPAANTQTLAGHVFDCSGGTATTVEVSGGTMSATGPVNISAQGNPILPTAVPAGTYTMVASAPPGYDMVACGGPATVTSVSAAHQSVVVPAGSRGLGTFYVALATPAAASAGNSPGNVPGTVTPPAPTPASKSTSGGALAFTGVAGLLKILGLGGLLVLAGWALLVAARRRHQSPAPGDGGATA